MKKFYKAFLFLFILNALLLGLSGLLLPVRFLIPAFALAFILDLFLLFFMGAYVKKNYLLSAFPPDDSCKLNPRFEQLKAQYSFKKIQLLKPAKIDSACFYLSDLNGSLIVISENILESFSQEDMACFLSYAFQKIKSGDAVFLTVLSSFLFLWEKFFYGISYPFIYFKQQKRKAWDKSLKGPYSKKNYARDENKDNSAYLNKPDQQQIFSNQMGLAFGILSLMTRNLFYNNDRLLYQTSLSFPLLAKDSHRQGLDNNKENADHNNRENTDNKENTNNKENADHNNRENTDNKENTNNKENADHNNRENTDNKENTNNKENADHNNRENTDNKENTNNKENADHNNRENTDNRENTNPNNKENNDKNKNDDSWNKSHTGDSMWKNSNRANLKERVRKQALFLWKLDSFLALNPPQLPLFFAPLFLTNFLTNLSKKDYIPLQPSIKNRVKKLVGGYPP